MKKGLVKLEPENIILRGVEYFHYEGLYNENLYKETLYENNEYVIVFPIKKTKQNKDSYDASLFHVATKIGCRPWGYDDLSLCYRLYPTSKRLELALNYANSSNDWNECIEIELDCLDSEELDFIRNWFIGHADEKITEIAMNTYGLTEDNYIGCRFDLIEAKCCIKWYEKNDECYRLKANNIFELQNLSSIQCSIFINKERINHE